MSCALDKYGSPVGFNCAHDLEKKQIMRVVFLDPTIWAALQAASTSQKFDKGTEDKKKNAIIATQLALQAGSATEEAKITWTGIIKNFAIAAPEVAEISPSPNIVPAKKVVTSRTITLDDMEAYEAKKTLAGGLGAPSDFDSIFDSDIETTSLIAQHINHKAIREGSGTYVVAYTDSDGKLYPFRTPSGDSIYLSVSNYADKEAIGTTDYTVYKYEIKGTNSGDWYTENMIAYTDLSVDQTTPGASSQYLDLLYKI